MVAVMLSCVDNIPDADLAALQVMYVDGRNDNFDESRPRRRGTFDSLSGRGDPAPQNLIELAPGPRSPAGPSSDSAATL